VDFHIGATIDGVYHTITGSWDGTTGAATAAAAFTIAGYNFALDLSGMIGAYEISAGTAYGDPTDLALTLNSKATGTLASADVAGSAKM